MLQTHKHTLKNLTYLFKFNIKIQKIAEISPTLIELF